MQLQLFYQLAEDRLLLVLAFAQRNTGFWLTRRMTGLLWQALWKRAGASVDAVVSELAKQWLLRLQEERSREKQAVSKQARLQPSAAPLLVTTVKFGPSKDGGHMIWLLDEKGRGEMMNLADDDLYGFIRLIDGAVANSDWNLDLWRPAERLAQPDALASLH